MEKNDIKYMNNIVDFVNEVQFNNHNIKIKDNDFIEVWKAIQNITKSLGKKDREAEEEEVSFFRIIISFFSTGVHILMYVTIWPFLMIIDPMPLLRKDNWKNLTSIKGLINLFNNIIRRGCGVCLLFIQLILCIVVFSWIYNLFVWMQKEKCSQLFTSGSQFCVSFVNPGKLKLENFLQKISYILQKISYILYRYR